jgi:hydroxypyruvate reductase
MLCPACAADFYFMIKMFHTSQQFRDDLLSIWTAGVAGVKVDRLVRRAVAVNDNNMQLGGKTFPLDTIDRIVVIGGGKASGAMAESLENILAPACSKITGWVNVPDDCVKSLKKIHLHPARPLGVNEPTVAAVEGTNEIIRLADSLTASDICIALISGGGSALMCAPAGITLDEKVAETRRLSAAGATIQELNAFRKTVSFIKGGKLAARCRGKRLVSLILSDVLGDPLDVIASAPTIEPIPDPLHSNVIIGNLATAVEAAADEARKRGYNVATQIATQAEGTAEEVGLELFRWGVQTNGANCFISGGEPVVRLVPPERRGKGGRNQQLVLAALLEYLREHSTIPLYFLSGGTDGEDGPTDAAGAWFDPQMLESLTQRMSADTNFRPESFLERNDAYTFFQPLGTLLKTGATGTNVCDLRVILAERER